MLSSSARRAPAAILSFDWRAQCGESAGGDMTFWPQVICPNFVGANSTVVPKIFALLTFTFLLYRSEDSLNLGARGAARCNQLPCRLTRALGGRFGLGCGEARHCVIGFVEALLSQAAKANEGGVSFWVPGFFGSLAAVRQQPGMAAGGHLLRRPHASRTHSGAP
jgi:hypothetical protein